MANQRSLIAGVSGVRGIVGSGLNPEIASRYTAAFATIIPPGTVVIGRDSRESGPIFSGVVTSVLQLKGFSVIDLGLASTPTVEIMVTELKASGGVIITASHNGPEWNALKFLDSSGEFLSGEEMDRLNGMVAGGGNLYTEVDEIGFVQHEDFADAIHIKKVLELDVVDREVIGGRGLKAVVDCVNGAGSRIIPSLLRSLNVEVVEINTDPEAPFPHEPEPRPENLKDLAVAVKEHGADIGFACDPDADRLVLADSLGNVCSEEMTVVLACDFILSKVKGPVVVNMSTTALVDHVCTRHGVKLYRSRVGEANVVEMMKSTGAVIGGEGNGGVIYPELHYGRDAIVGVALILQSLAESGNKLRDMIAALPDYYMVKKKLHVEMDEEKMKEAVKKAFKGMVNEDDGIRIDMDDGWIHVRRSNTEPIVRVIAEAGSVEDAEGMIDRFIKTVNG